MKSSPHIDTNTPLPFLYISIHKTEIKLFLTSHYSLPAQRLRHASNWPAPTSEMAGVSVSRLHLCRGGT